MPAVRRLLPFLAAPAILFAARDASAFRPFDGTDADVAGLGEFELELGPVSFLAEGNTHYLIAPGGVLNFGIAHRLELVIDFKTVEGLDYVPGQDGVRLLDDDVLLKYVIREGALQGKTGLSIAEEAGPLTPNINGQKSFGASANTIVTYVWSSGAVHFNNQFELSRAQNFDFFSSVILEGNKKLPVRPVAEFFFEKEWNVEEKYSALVGGIWEVSHALQLDLALRVAREADLPVEELRLGFTWTIPLFGGAEEEDAEKKKASFLSTHALPPR